MPVRDSGLGTRGSGLGARGSGLGRTDGLHRIIEVVRRDDFRFRDLVLHELRQDFPQVGIVFDN